MKYGGIKKEEELRHMTVTSRKTLKGIPAVVKYDHIRHNGAALFALGWISVSYTRNQNVKLEIASVAIKINLF